MKYSSTLTLIGLITIIPLVFLAPVTQAQNHPFSQGATSVLMVEAFFKEYRNTLNRQRNVRGPLQLQQSDGSVVTYEILIPITPKGRTPLPYNPFSAPGTGGKDGENVYLRDVSPEVHAQVLATYIQYIKKEIQIRIDQQKKSVREILPPQVNSKTEVKKQPTTLLTSSPVPEATRTSVPISSPSVRSSAPRRSFSF